MNKAKNKLLDLFSKIEQEVRPLNLHYNSKILIIDGINTFLRSFAAVNHINSYGSHVGGLTGFLKSVCFAIKQIQPTRCIIVFDGEGGSTNRKYLYPEYKGNRNTPRLVNYKSFNNKKEEDQAKYDEMSRLIEYLEMLPLSLMSIDKLEADDIMGYLSKKVYKEYDDSQIYIMSSDNDFLQLVNDRTFLYSPIKKKTYDVKMVEDEFGVHPSNFLLYKTLIGDTSDNIPGVNGLGEKNVPLLFEEFKSPDRKTLDDLYEICENPPKKSVLYQRILEMKHMVEIFYKIMNLSEPNISEDDSNEINRQFYTKPPTLRKYDFFSLIRHDRISDPTLLSDSWINSFSILNNF